MGAENKIKSVKLVIDAVDGQSIEIPMEGWQVGVISQIIGLSVDLSLSGKYAMSSKESVDERMAIYNNALKQLYEK